MFCELVQVENDAIFIQFCYLLYEKFDMKYKGLAGCRDRTLL